MVTIGVLSDMTQKLAIALGGGGARGAYQVGALRAIFEAGYVPEIVTGASIGAMNAACIGLWGATIEAGDPNEAAWVEGAALELLHRNNPRALLRALVGRPDSMVRAKTLQFLEDIGITSQLTFRELTHARIGMVSSDLENAEPLIYGLNPDDRVQDGILASVAIQPWIMPIREEGRYLVDGGLVSNTPIEAALRMGATEIIALSLREPYSGGQKDGVNDYLNRLAYTISLRMINLEQRLAESRGVRVHFLQLHGPEPFSTWDFENAMALIPAGYEITRSWLESGTSLGE